MPLVGGFGWLELCLYGIYESWGRNFSELSSKSRWTRLEGEIFASFTFQADLASVQSGPENTFINNLAVTANRVIGIGWFPMIGGGKWSNGKMGSWTWNANMDPTLFHQPRDFVCEKPK